MQVPCVTVAATNTQTGSTWMRWLESQLSHKGWSQRELGRKAGIDHSRISKWKRGESPDIPTIRAICHALDLPAVEGFIAAGILSADDVGATVIQRPDVRLLSNAELLGELSRRMVDPVEDSVSLPDEIARGAGVDIEQVSALIRTERNELFHGNVRATNTYVELADDEGHSRIVRIDPRSFGQEGEAWAARRRDDQGQTAQEG